MAALDKHKIAALTQAVKPHGYLDYRDYLGGLYRWLKASEKRYSYIAFAEEFGFSRTNVLHLIIRGKRPLSRKAAEKISNLLGLTGLEKSYFEVLVAYQNSRNSSERESLMRKLLDMKRRTLTSAAERAQLEFFSEWFHPAIYEMTQLEDFESDPKWISDRLRPRIRPEQARKSLQLLEGLDLISYDEANGRHVPMEFQISTGDEITSVAVIRYHQKLIEMGRESITRIHEDERDISAITICVSNDLAQKMKQEIQIFRKKMMALAEESKSSDAVYQMNVQLFPLTK